MKTQLYSQVSIMIKNVSAALKSSTDDFCSLVGPSIPTNSTNKASFNLVKTLEETERIADSFPALLEEALNEPILKAESKLHFAQEAK
jgi:hypothetical protein